MENRNWIWKTSQHRGNFPSADMSPRQSSSSRLPAPEGKQVRQKKKRKRPDLPFSRAAWNKEMTSGAAALQSGQRVPRSTKLNIPSSELQTYLWRVSPSWEHVQQGWQPSHPTPAQTHICSASLQHTARQVGRVWISVTAREDFPSGSPSCPLCRAKGAELGCLHLLGCPSWNNNGNLEKKKFMLEVFSQDFFFNQIQGSASESSVSWKFNPSTEAERREKAAKPTNLNFQSEGSKSFLLS